MIREQMCVCVCVSASAGSLLGELFKMMMPRWGDPVGIDFGALVRVMGKLFPTQMDFAGALYS